MSCGVPLVPDAARGISDAGHDTAAERRLMTVLFCDLVGSSALTARLDPEDFADLIVAYRERCVAVVARYGGYVSRYAGDGVIACFGYPRALGRDAQAAVACGLAMTSEIRKLARDTRLRGGRDLAVRIGIETGLVLAGRLGPSGASELDGLVGTAPNVAARLQELAEPHGLVIGEATHELVADAFHCEELPSHRTVRLQPPTRAFAVRGAVAQFGHRFLTRRRAPLVSRQQEMSLIRERWAAATAGNGQTVLLSGEAGIGKSRLCQELLADLAEGSDNAIVFRCTPQAASSAFYPAIEQLRKELARQADGGDAGVDAEGFARLADRLGFGGGAAQAVLTQALGLDPAATLDRVPAARRRLILDALQAWLLGHARDEPLLIVVEDLQWSDPSLLELLHEMSDVLVSHKILLIATFRSNFVLSRPDHPGVLRISLPPLDPQESQQLLDALGGDQPREMQASILAKSDGVPLFLEEFSLVPTAAMPRTLQELFTARLDALGKAKRLAQCAAVLDPHIEPDLLAGLSGLADPVVEQWLAELVDAEWLVHRASPPATAFAFRHALLREAATESLRRAERRGMHAKAAALLPARRPALAEQQPEVVASHHLLGGQPSEAVALYLRAGRRALEGAALGEAEAHVENGLRGLRDLVAHDHGEWELELQVLRGNVLIARRGYANATVQEAFEAALAVAMRVPHQAHTAFALRGLASFYQVRGPLSRASAICDQLVAAAEQSGDPLVLVDALRRRGWNRGCMGRFAEAEADLARSLDLYAPGRRDAHITTAGHDPQVLALSNLAWLHVPRHGLPSAARMADAAAIAAGASPHAVSACYGLVLAAFILQRADRWDEALVHVDRARAIAAEKGFAYWVALAEVADGFDRAMRRGAAAQGVEAIRRGLAGYRETQGELLRPFILSLVADAAAAGGELGAADAAMQEAVATAETLEAHGFLPDLLFRHARILGDAAAPPERRSVVSQRCMASARRYGAEAILQMIGERVG